MAYFLYQWAYKDPAVKAMVATPHDRSDELRKAVEGFGGTLHQFFYALGEYDGLAIVEFPDTESCTACSLTLNAAGANAAFKTTVLIGPEEGWRAMRRAGEAQTGYRAPVGYESHG